MANINLTAKKDVKVQIASPYISAKLSTDKNISAVTIKPDAVSGSINVEMNVSSNIKSNLSINGAVKTCGEINGSVLLPDESYTTPIYSGPYSVKPSSSDDQTLSTRDLLLTNNVVFLKIPTYETSNNFGTTLIIGE